MSTARVYQTLIVTPAFEGGRRAARRDAAKMGGEPLVEGPQLVQRRGAEFVAGYRLVVAEFNALPETHRLTQIAAWRGES